MSSATVAADAESAPNLLRWVTGETTLLFISGTIVYVAVNKVITDLQETVLNPALRTVFGVDEMHDTCDDDDTPDADKPKYCKDRYLNVKLIELAIAILEAALLVLIAYLLIRRMPRPKAPAMPPAPSDPAMANPLARMGL